MISPECEASLRKLRLVTDQLNGMPVVLIIHEKLGGADALVCAFGPPLTQEVFSKALEALLQTGKAKGLKIKL